MPSKERAALAFLRGALDDAEQAEETAPDGSRVERVAQNTRRWAEKSVRIAERETETGPQEDSDE